MRAEAALVATGTFFPETRLETGVFAAGFMPGFEVAGLGASGFVATGLTATGLLVLATTGFAGTCFAVTVFVVAGFTQTGFNLTAVGFAVAAFAVSGTFLATETRDFGAMMVVAFAVVTAVARFAMTAFTAEIFGVVGASATTADFGTTFLTGVFVITFFVAGDLSEVFAVDRTGLVRSVFVAGFFVEETLVVDFEVARGFWLDVTADDP